MKSASEHTVADCRNLYSVLFCNQCKSTRRERGVGAQDEQHSSSHAELCLQVFKARTTS